MIGFSVSKDMKEIRKKEKKKKENSNISSSIFSHTNCQKIEN